MQGEAQDPRAIADALIAEAHSISVSTSARSSPSESTTPERTTQQPSSPERSEPSVAVVQDEFDQIDTDHNGVIDRREFSEYVSKQAPAESSWERIVRQEEAELASQLSAERNAQHKFTMQEVPEELDNLLEDHRLYQLWDQLEASYIQRLKFREGMLELMAQNTGIDVEEPDGPLDQIVMNEVRALRPQVEKRAGMAELVKRREALKRRAARGGSAVEELYQMDEQLLHVLQQWQFKHNLPFEFRGVNYLKMMKLEQMQSHLKSVPVQPFGSSQPSVIRNA